MSLQVQFFTFFMMFSSGWALGILFDVYRVVTRPLKLGRITFSIMDLIYWLAATVFVFRVLYLSNHGELRFFIFLGLLLGTWFYYAFISSYTIITIKFIMRLVKRVAIFSLRCVQVLIVKPTRLIYKLIVIMLGFFLAIAIFIFKIVVQLLYPLWAVTKWIGKLIPRPIWMMKSARWLKRQAKRLF